MSLGNTLVLTGLAVIGVALMSPSSLKRPGARAADRPFAAASSPLKRGSSDAGYGSRELLRNADGHFYADAQINGHSIRLMVDTGASVIMLTREDAQRAGVAVPTERALAMGVGGTVAVAPVTIGRIALGGVDARDVQAAVADQLPVSLLGQNFLAQFESVEIRGDTMVLR
ncbi:MAG: aspartyl protease family protein [Sphingomonadales bacterium]|jgi:aspartyl protease family protein|nr:aspartyl protease family protein [Sphingomonadales bacterium]